MTIVSSLSKLLAPSARLKNAPQVLTPTFHIRESQLCAQLGVSKDELRLRRQYFLTQGRHWDYVNKRVLLSTVGAQVLRGTAGFSVPVDFIKNAPAADSEAPRPVVAAGLLLEKNPPPVVFSGQLVAWSAPTHNTRILIAYLPGTDPANPMNLVTCFVRSNLNFTRGMHLPGPGRQVKQLDPARYELLGECPRLRGRW